VGRFAVALSISIAMVRTVLNFYSIVKPDRLRSEVLSVYRAVVCYIITDDFTHCFADSKESYESALSVVHSHV